MNATRGISAYYKTRMEYVALIVLQLTSEIKLISF